MASKLTAEDEQETDAKVEQFLKEYHQKNNKFEAQDSDLKIFDNLYQK